MVICRYFADRIECPLLDRCLDEHFDIVSFVTQEVESAINGNQWPLSCFGPIPNKPSIPNYIEDQSFEEIRTSYYESKKFTQTCRELCRAMIEAEQKKHLLLAMSNDVLDILMDIHDYDDESNEPSSLFLKNNNPFGKKTTFNSNTEFFGDPAGVFPVAGSIKKAKAIGPFDRQPVIDFPQTKSSFAEICPFQQTQKQNNIPLKRDASVSALPSQGSFDKKGCDDCKELMKDVASRMDTICKIFVENKAATKLLQENILVNSEKPLSISQNDDESNLDKNIEKALPYKKSPAILIKPNRRQGSGKTVKYIKSNIDPTKLSIQINNIIRRPFGSIIIECKNEESVKKLEKHVKLACGSYYDSQILFLENPRIMVSGIDCDIDENKLIGVIKQQNKLKFEMKLIQVVEDINDSSKYNAIVEVDKEHYKILTEDQDPYFNIGWTKCNVYDNVDVKRCSSCWGFNHTASNCRTKAHIPKQQI